MVLIDIGNTNYHVMYKGKIKSSENIEMFDDKVFYISVNRHKEQKLLSLNPHAVNLKEYVDFNTEYKGLGIDRIMACKSVSDGVVVDAGSAVTIDVMENGVHKGGIITLGLYAFKRAFGTISEVLTYEYKHITEKIPLNTEDALNYGSLGAVLCLVENIAGDKKVYLTGGDGKFLSRFIKNSEYIPDLVFRGMIKTIEEMEKK
jgi:type III pantothenate kinase